MQHNYPSPSAVISHSSRGGSSGQLMLPWMTVRREPREGSGMALVIYPWSRPAPGRCSAICTVGLGNGHLVLDGGGTPGAGWVVRHLRSPSTWLSPQCTEAQLQNCEGRLGKKEGGRTRLKKGRWRRSNSLDERRTNSPWLGSAIDSPVEEAEAQTEDAVVGRLAGSITTAAAISATVEPGWLHFRPSTSWRLAGRAWRVLHFLLSGRWSLPWGGWETPRGSARTSLCSSQEPLKLTVMVLLLQGKLLPPTLLVLNCHCLLLQLKPPPQDRLSGRALPHPRQQELATRPNGLQCGRAFPKGLDGARSWRRSHRRMSHQRKRALDLELISLLRSCSCFILICLSLGIYSLWFNVILCHSLFCNGDSVGVCMRVSSRLSQFLARSVSGIICRNKEVCPCAGESNFESKACNVAVPGSLHRTYRSS